MMPPFALLFADDPQIPWWAAALMALGTGVLGPAAKWVWDAFRTRRQERKKEEAEEDRTVIEHQRAYIAEQERRYEAELAKRDAKIERLEQRADTLTAASFRDHEEVARLRAEVRYLREKMSEHKIPLSRWDVLGPPPPPEPPPPCNPQTPPE